MAEQWIIRVEEKDYGPVDLATLQEWKSEGRLLPVNPARRVDVNFWQTAADIPGLFETEPQPVQRGIRANAGSTGTVSRAELRPSVSAHAAATQTARPPTRNILIDTFRIYFRGFFQYVGLTLLSIVPILCAEFTGRFIGAGSEVNVDPRTLIAASFGLCMLVLRIVLIPVYIAGIQILTAQLATGQRVGFLSVLNGAVKYWPRVAGLGLFIYGVFILLTIFGVGVLLMMLAGAISSSFFSIVLALGLAALQIWLFCRFFIYVLFWQQFVVLENANFYEALRQSRTLARSGRDLPWYQRPLWRGGLIFSIWMAFVIAITIVALWPKIAAEWPLFQQAFNQLSVGQDPESVVQKLMASLPKDQAASFSELGLTILQRILQPLLGIALVVLYLDSKLERPSHVEPIVSTGEDDTVR
jgi:hypothetical protein